MKKTALQFAPLKSKWRRKPGYVRHVFTHFPLELSVYVAEMPQETPAPKGARFVKVAKLGKRGATVIDAESDRTRAQ